VQTFLPYPDCAASAAVLDDRRLGKQRVEALQVLRALARATYGWKHHPAVRMWVGYPEAVAAYGLAVCEEWVRRGRADTCAATITADLAEAGLPPPRTQEEWRIGEGFPPGSVISGCIRATTPRWYARTQSFTDRCSPTSTPRCPISGPLPWAEGGCSGAAVERGSQGDRREAASHQPEAGIVHQRW
jgi:hypothetical protein